MDISQRRENILSLSFLCISLFAHLFLFHCIFHYLSLYLFQLSLSGALEKKAGKLMARGRETKCECCTEMSWYEARKWEEMNTINKKKRLRNWMYEVIFEGKKWENLKGSKKGYRYLKSRHDKVLLTLSPEFHLGRSGLAVLFQSIDVWLHCSTHISKSL